MKVSRSSRSLMMRLLLGGTTLVISVAAWYSYQAVRNLTLESLKRNAFLEVQRGAKDIDSWLVKLKAHVETLANTPVVRSMNWAKAEPYLKTEIFRFEDVSAIAIGKPNGWRQVTGGKPTSIKDRHYFQKAMAGYTNVSDPLVSRASGIVSIVVATPIWPAFNSTIETTSPLGEIHSIVKLNRIGQVVNRLKYGSHSYAFALNSKGEVLAHPDRNLMSTLESPTPKLPQVADQQLAEIAQRMVSKKQGIELTQLDGQWQYVGYVPLIEADWSVALVIPRANIEDALRSLDMIALAFALLVGTLLLILWRVQAVEQANLKKSNEDLEQRVTERTTELSSTLEKLQQSQLQLIQSEKMSSLGQLVAGVAHEINNPVSFIHGNLSHVDEYAQNLLTLVHLYQQEYPPSPKIKAAIAEIDLNFLAADLPKVLFSMKVGTERIQEIVKSLRTFSRKDEAEKKYVDIHAGLDSTLLILQHRLKPKSGHCEIQVVKNYGQLPLVECYASQLNQVFMNILVNAIDAIEQYQHSVATNHHSATNHSSAIQTQDYAGTITISTSVLDDQQIQIMIADDGPGMTEAVQQRLFDPFYTTKPVGKGTGLGLSISHQIITEKHGGALFCSSTPGHGAKFIIQIPRRTI